MSAPQTFTERRSLESGLRIDTDTDTGRRVLVWTYVLLTIAIFIFAIATIYGFFKLRQESATAHYNSQSALWLVVSFEREYLKLDGFLLRYQARDPGLDPDDLLTQFDVLWSRIELMYEGEKARPLEQVGSFQQAVPVTFQLLRDHETQIFEGVPAGLPLPPSFVSAYRELADPIHQFMVDVHINRSWAVEVREAKIRDVRLSIYFTLAGTLGSTLLLFAIVIMQLKGRHDNLLRTRTALAQSERDSNALRDEVSRRMNAEQERKALMIDLEARNEELERYAYTISHDLKSPLYTIQGFAGFLERDINKGDADNMLNDLAKIRKAVITMGTLLDDILNLSKVNLSQESMQPVSLDQVIGAAMSLVSRELEEHKIDIQLDPNLPMVMAEPQRLTEVFQNLLSNASKFMGEQQHPVIVIGAVTEGDMVRCHVHDNGIGIQPEYRERVFNLFERLETGAEGSGVGLAIVKRIIERHGGRIWIEAGDIDAGTRFEFTLPVATAN